MQLKRIALGEGRQSTHAIDFWGSAFIAGGVVGVYGDFPQSCAFATQGDPSANDVRTVAVMAADESGALLGPAPCWRMDDEAAFGLQAIRRVKDRMAGSSLYHLKLALDRAVFSHLCLAGDPAIAAGLAEIEKQAEEEAERDYRQARIAAAGNRPLS